MLLKYLLNEVFDLGIKARLEGQGNVVDCLLNLLQSLSSVGGVAVAKLVQQNTQGPNVCLLGLSFLLENLRRHVLVGPAHSLSVLLLLEERGPAKVPQLNLLLLAEKNVLRLEVTVHDILLMQILDGLARFFEKTQILLLGGFMLSHVGKEISIGGVLQKNVNLTIGLKEVDEPNDVRVAEIPVKVNLLVHPFLFAVDLNALHGIKNAGIILVTH